MQAAVALAPAPTRVTAVQTDAELVAALRRGNDRAFEELYNRYHRRISSYIFGMVKDHARAEDLTQDVFMSALRRMRDTDRPIAFKPWVYEIAKNACIDQFRRNRRAEEVSYDAEEGLGAADYGRLVNGDPTPDVALDHKQQLDHLRGALGGLSDAHHQILVMREFEGLSYREIGEKMGMSRPSVESTLFRARKRLTEEYEELVTGTRCTRVQGILSSAGGAGLGARDRRRMARHLSYCQPCRRHAHACGLSEVVPERVALGAKIAGVLPLPAFLRRRFFGQADDSAVSATVGHGGTLAQWSANLAPMVDSAGAGWAKAVVTAATVAVAGVSAGAMTGGRDLHLQRPFGPASLVSSGGSHGPSASAATRSAALSAGTVSVPPRSAAGAPTPKLPETTVTKPSGSSSTGGAPAAAGKGSGQQAPGDDPLSSVTRGLGNGLGSGGNDGSGGPGGDSGTDDYSGDPTSHGPRLPSPPQITAPVSTGTANLGSGVKNAAAPVETGARDAAPASGAVIDEADQAIDQITSAAQQTIDGTSGTAGSALGQLTGG